MKIHPVGTNLPVSVEVGQVNTDKYVRLIQTSFLPMYFNKEFIRCVFRCKQTFSIVFMSVLNVMYLSFNQDSSSVCFKLGKITSVYVYHVSISAY